jgi:hypothetical protein
MRTKDQLLLEQAYQQILNEWNPFKRSQPQPAAAPAQSAPQQPQSPADKLISAINVLVKGASNVKIERTSKLDGDKHDSTMFIVNGKTIVDITPEFDMIQITTNPNAPVKVNPNSGSQGLDQVYNALREAGVAFDRRSEDYAFGMV